MSQNEDEKISEDAEKYARENQKKIAGKILGEFASEENPISIFMAGSPGAGKTETSKRLLKNIGEMPRIDADELRNCFTECGYNGANSHLFQKAVTNLVHGIHDAALKKGISFLLDSTFSNENIAGKNIERSLKRNRDVFVLFVYQSPRKAWNFVQQREIVEGRRIRREDFAKKFCASWEVANKMKRKFKNKIALRLICKNIDGTEKFYRKNVERIEDHIPEKYTEEQILDAIK